MEHTIYKPNKKETGGAIKLNLHKSGKFAFMKAAKQIAPMGSTKMFGWEDEVAINVKMGITDLSEMLSVIEKYKKDTKLYHQTDNDNKVIEFTDVPERGGFSLSISHKFQGNKEANSVFVGISYAEAMIVKKFLEDAIGAILWNASIYETEQRA